MLDLVRRLSWRSSSHQWVYTDVSIKWAAGDHGWVPRTPLHVKAPLTASRQLIHHLNTQQVIANCIHILPPLKWVNKPVGDWTTRHILCFHWIGHPRKPHGRCKHLRSMCHTSRVTVDFSPNFVAMATRVGCTTFCMVPLNRPSPKTPW